MHSLFSDEFVSNKLLVLLGNATEWSVHGKTAPIGEEGRAHLLPEQVIQAIQLIPKYSNH